MRHVKEETKKNRHQTTSAIQMLFLSERERECEKIYKRMI